MPDPIRAPSVRRRLDDSTAVVPEYVRWIAELPKPIGIFAVTDDRARHVALA